VASILAIGSDAALLEGLSQTLSAAGHRVTIASDIPEALETLRGARPLVALVNRDELLSGGGVFRVALASGGALLAFRTADEVAARLPFQLQRATLADLVLPLERQRLLALIRNVESRALASGRFGEDVDSTQNRSG
jgi:CheY-like chemotaxis protein